MEQKPDTQTGFFAGLNDNEGIMICGYEWGGKKEEDGKGGALLLSQP